MAPTCDQIQTLVTRVQNAFLEVPALQLTLPRAQRRFGVDATTCEAVFGALVEAGVLMTTPDGAYVRHFPRAA